MKIRKQFQIGAALFLAMTAIACGQGRDEAAAMPETGSMPQDAATSVEMNKAAFAANSAPVGGVLADTETQVARGGGATAAPIAPQLASLLTHRSVIRKADLTVRVKNVEKGENTIDHIVLDMGGYVDSAQSADLASGNPTMDISLRVPVGQFDTALEKFEALGDRMSKTISSEDVTGQIVDLDARLETMKAQEETYRNLLRAARQLDNVITLQDKLTQVRGEIESMAAQRKTLGGLAAFSTVTVHLLQSAEAVAPPSDPNWLAQVWGESTTTASSVGRAVTAFLVWLAVFSPFWAPVLVIGWRLVRPRKSAQVQG